jgi:SAM-dependent methyltransferase
MYSYSSRIKNLSSLIQETIYRSKHIDNIRFKLAHARHIEKLIFQQYGIELRGLDILDIGTGQFLIQMQYFARHNRVTGIDTNVIVQGASPGAYAKMLALNGPVRVAKTIVRKLIGIDRQVARDLKNELCLDRLPKLPVHLMDACNLTFGESSFDFVHCHAVLHHVKDPGSALAGIVRVLKPEGALYIQVHLYTSETGSLDPRAFLATVSELPRWSHLRPQYMSLVNTNAFLNKLRLSEWIELFNNYFPGAKIIPSYSKRAGAENDASALIDSGEIQGYSVEELVTHDITVLWRKSR